MPNFILHSSVFIFLVLVPIALSQDSPSPSPISHPPTTSEVNSPPSPPPTESPSPTPSPPPTDSPSPTPSPSPSPSDSHTPSPSPDSADLSHSGALDDHSAGDGKSEGMSGGRKAGIAFAVIVCAVAVVICGVVYKKRRENIRRQQYAFSGRGEIQL